MSTKKPAKTIVVLQDGVNRELNMSQRGYKNNVSGISGEFNHQELPGMHKYSVVTKIKDESSEVMVN